MARPIPELAPVTRVATGRDISVPAPARKRPVKSEKCGEAGEPVGLAAMLYLVGEETPLKLPA
jgi:hypothetical protein